MILQPHQAPFEIIIEKQEQTNGQMNGHTNTYQGVPKGLMFIYFQMQIIYLIKFFQISLIILI